MSKEAWFKEPEKSHKYMTSLVKSIVFFKTWSPYLKTETWGNNSWTRNITCIVRAYLEHILDFHSSLIKKKILKVPIFLLYLQGLLPLSPCISRFSFFFLSCFLATFLLQILLPLNSCPWKAYCTHKYLSMLFSWS